MHQLLIPTKTGRRAHVRHVFSHYKDQIKPSFHVRTPHNSSGRVVFTLPYALFFIGGKNRFSTLYNQMVTNSEWQTDRTSTGSEACLSPAQPLTALPSLTKLLLFLVLLCLVLQLNSHFWLDETVTFWITNAGRSQIVSRCIRWPQSVLYGNLFLLLRSMGDFSPWIYRCPSLLAMTGTVILIFRIGLTQFSKEVAWLSAAIFVSFESVEFAAVDARPYSLGLFFAVLSTYQLLILLARPSKTGALWYGITAGLVLHLHMLFVPVLFVHLLYFFTRRWSIRRLLIPLSHLAIALGSLIALCIPLIPQYVTAFKSAAVHSFAARPGPNDFLGTFFPPTIQLALLVMGIGLMLPVAKKQMASVDNSMVGSLVVFWTFAPPICLFLLSTVSSAQVWVPRYLLTCLPGLSLGTAIILLNLRVRWPCYVTICFLILLAAKPLLHFQTLRHDRYLGDWAAATRFINDTAASANAVVLVRSQFPESNSFALDPVEDNPLFSQFLVYPPKFHVFPLERTFHDSQIGRLEKFLSVQQALSATRFYFIFYGGDGPGGSVIYYLMGRLGSKWQIKISEFDGLNVAEFYRPANIKL